MATTPRRTLKTPGATEDTQQPEEQLALAIRELASFKNDPEAMQERIAELKPEIANPNLAADMAKRPDRTKTTPAKLTDKGWLV